MAEPRKARYGAVPARVAPAGWAGWRRLPLDGVGLSARISRRLVAAGIHTLGDLAEWTPSALCSLRGIHAVSVLEIELCLARARNAKGGGSSDPSPRP